VIPWQITRVFLFTRILMIGSVELLLVELGGSFD